MKNHEKRRLNALRNLDILDSPAEDHFDKITQAAKEFFKTKIALFTLVDERRQWFKSNQGLGVDETPRSIAFCSYAIRKSDIFIVNDATLDPTFMHNPLVVGAPFMRFYAGAPVREPRGFTVGTICIIDDKPRNYTKADLKGLRLLADICESLLIYHSKRLRQPSQAIVRKLDRAIQRAQTIFLSNEDNDVAFDYVLKDLIDISQSRYGLIGEVLEDENAKAYMQVRAITNLSWNEASEALFQKHKEEGMLFRNQNNILGMPLKTGKTIIANDILHDARAMGKPTGHPTLWNYIGIPIFIADKLVAIVGLANKDGDYQEELEEDIARLLNTIGNLVERTQLIRNNKQQQKMLEEVAYFDELTGLPNRRRLRELFDEAVEQSRKNRHQSIAICFLDIDGFKEINDTYGHSTGDHALREIAGRLLSELREIDSVARLGGDEFVIVLPDFSETHILERILKAVCEPIVHLNVAINVTASMGVTTYPQDNSDFDKLLRHADQAMYAAKQSGKNQFNLFDVDLHSANSERLSALTEIINAVENSQFELFYQPQLDITERKVKGFEALIRWRHPEKGILEPAMFIDKLEHTEHARKLGMFVIQKAIEQLVTWNKQGLDYTLSINASTSHFLSAEFKHDMTSALTRVSQAVRSKLTVELLETITSDNIDQVVTTVDYCHGLGINLSLDDFGTGYSSLEYFRRLKVHEIKIDRSFVDVLLQSKESNQIVMAIINLSKTFERTLVAEGVENLATSRMLIDIGCNVHQGFFYCKPLPAAEALSWAEDISFDDLI